MGCQIHYEYYCDICGQYSPEKDPKHRYYVEFRLPPEVSGEEEKICLHCYIYDEPGHASCGSDSYICPECMAKILEEGAKYLKKQIHTERAKSQGLMRWEENQDQ